jgi:hypothetical protein
MCEGIVPIPARIPAITVLTLLWLTAGQRRQTLTRFEPSTASGFGSANHKIIARASNTTI